MARGGIPHVIQPDGDRKSQLRAAQQNFDFINGFHRSLLEQLQALLERVEALEKKVEAL